MLYWRLRSLVQRLHRASPIHILHAHAALPCGEAARRLGRELGVAVVVTVHGLDAYLTEQVSGVAGQQCAIGCRRVYQDAKRVICISEEVRRRILAGSSSLRSTEVVYNGVDTSVFAPTQHSANRDPVVASVGSLIPIKGHDVTLRAIAELNADFSRLRVRIVGEGVEQRRLQALARELGIADRVDFLGRRTRQEVAELLQSSAIFVLPSRFEGLGVAYLEAMASGLPTIAYRGQGIQEVIRHGENGILVAEQAAEAAPRAWAAVLRRLLKNDEMRQALGAAGRHTVEEGYTLRHQAQALLRVYEECLV
jgi:glycosyltransferase involved in cell wall biosynthesis